MKRMAAMIALRPVRGALGSKMEESAALDDEEEEPPLEVEVLPFVWALASLTLQVVSPLMMPCEAALLKSVHRESSLVLD